MIDTEFLKALTEAPAVGTACGPVVNLLTARFGAEYGKYLVPDGFCLFQKGGVAPEKLRAVFVAHMDEVGGVALGPRPAPEGGGTLARFWGNTPDVFANATLQAFDYLAEDGSEAFPVRGQAFFLNGEARLALYGENIRPYRTGFTFREETTFDGDEIAGKALDPRVTLFAAAEAVRALDSEEVGALFVMAEECAMDVARKGVAYLERHAPNLQLIVNADVPGLQNLGEARLELPAIRIFEGRNFIDPSFGIRMADALTARGVEFHLTGARSGSQTLLFTPLAPTLSVALPSRGVHLPRVTMSLTGTRRCVDLLRALGEHALNA